MKLTEQQETHYLDFNQYRQDLKELDICWLYLKRTSIKFKNQIGLPDEISRAVFISVKLKGKNADWITANNACNAFEMKIKRILWKRKWKYVNTFIGSIEFDKEYLTYHFHILLILKEYQIDFR